jgi:ABC-type thiamine transport system substrate-binding protein
MAAAAVAAALKAWAQLAAVERPLATVWSEARRPFPVGARLMALAPERAGE